VKLTAERTSVRPSDVQRRQAQPPAADAAAWAFPWQRGEAIFYECRCVRAGVVESSGRPAGRRAVVINTTTAHTPRHGRPAVLSPSGTAPAPPPTTAAAVAGITTFRSRRLAVQSIATRRRHVLTLHSRERNSFFFHGRVVDLLMVEGP